MFFQHTLLNSSRNSRSELFKLKDIYVLVDTEEQTWFNQTHVRKFLGLVYLHRSNANLTYEDQKLRALSEAGPIMLKNWSEPKKQQNEALKSI